MSNLYWLNEDQTARLRPFFPKRHGKPRVDDPLPFTVSRQTVKGGAF
ncbi:hypothetical protein [Pseudorhodobacter turbinis]|nr:hypothetical protein [Pseudorhodobacter turbinis]